MTSLGDAAARAEATRSRSKSGVPPLRSRPRDNFLWRIFRRAAAAPAVCLVLAVGPATRGARSQTAGRVRAVGGFRITPVEGESWLKHLGLSFEASNLGRVGRWGPPPPRPSGQPPSGEGPGGDFLLTGADLYRLNCESCHEADGSGVPPEINSLIGPVQATSAAMIREQMKQRGIALDAKMVRQLASQAQASLRRRLQQGGQKMPAFGHLQGKEVEALITYLRELAGIPGADRKQVWIKEPAVRVGEHLVKGTCHICHDATGPGAGRMAVPGVIPSLASLTRDRSEAEVTAKVRQGRLPTPMPMMTSRRGEMPIFGYLTPEEVAAAYSYLVFFPPLP